MNLTIEELKKALSAIQIHICGYGSRTFCDCKFGLAKYADKFVMSYRKDPMKAVGSLGEITGCPEIRFLEAFFDCITPAEYERVCKRIGKSKKKNIPLGIRMAASQEFEDKLKRKVEKIANVRIIR